MHLQSGVDIRTVAAWLGRENLKTTIIYLKMREGAISAAK
jgi:site-specific recombinase XerD